MDTNVAQTFLSVFFVVYVILMSFMNEFSQTTVQSKILRLCLPQSSCKVNMHLTTFMSSKKKTPEDSGTVDIVSRSRWPRNASSLLGCLDLFQACTMVIQGQF